MEDGLKGNKTGNMCLKSNSSCGGSFRSCKCIYELWEKKTNLVSVSAVSLHLSCLTKNLRMYTILAILQKTERTILFPIAAAILWANIYSNFHIDCRKHCSRRTWLCFLHDHKARHGTWKQHDALTQQEQRSVIPADHFWFNHSVMETYSKSSWMHLFPFPPSSLQALKDVQFSFIYSSFSCQSLPCISEITPFHRCFADSCNLTSALHCC